MKKHEKFTNREMALLDAWSDYNQPPIDDAFEARVLDAVHEAAHSTCDLDMQLTEIDEVEEPCAAWNKVAIPGQWTEARRMTDASETRHADASEPMAYTRVVNKPTILFVAANPTRTSALALSEEAQAVESALERLGYRHCYNVETRWAAEPLDLLHALCKLNPSVVHYAGHGAMSSDLMGQRSNVISDRNESDGEPGGGLYFMSPNGDPEVISAQVLGDTFRAAGPDVRLVVLNACYSELHAEALSAHVSCVVGMRGTIGDDMARSFAAAFYGALGRPASVATAFHQACSALELEGLCESDRPQLKARDDIDIAKLGLGFLVSYTQGANGIEARSCSAADRPTLSSGPDRVRGNGPDVGVITTRNMSSVEAHVTAANHEPRPASATSDVSAMPKNAPSRSFRAPRPASATSDVSAMPKNAPSRSFRARQRNHHKAHYAINVTAGGGVALLSLLLVGFIGFVTMDGTVLGAFVGLLTLGSFGVLALVKKGRISWESRTDDRIKSGAQKQRRRSLR